MLLGRSSMVRIFLPTPRSNVNICPGNHFPGSNFFTPKFFCAKTCFTPKKRHFFAPKLVLRHKMHFLRQKTFLTTKIFFYAKKHFFTLKNFLWSVFSLTPKTSVVKNTPYRVSVYQKFAYPYPYPYTRFAEHIRAYSYFSQHCLRLLV